MNGRGQVVTSGKEEEGIFRQRGFGIKIGFGEKPALIVIDMLKGFTDPAMPLGANLDFQIEAQKPLLEAARKRAILCFFSTVLYEDGYWDAGIWGLKQKGAQTLKAGSEGVKVGSRLDMRRRTFYRSKNAFHVFRHRFVPRLTSRRVDTLIITGCTTSGCVPATAVDAGQNDIRLMSCARR